MNIKKKFYEIIEDELYYTKKEIEDMHPMDSIEISVWGIKDIVRKIFSHTNKELGDDEKNIIEKFICENVQELKEMSRKHLENMNCSSKDFFLIGKKELIEIMNFSDNLKK